MGDHAVRCETREQTERSWEPARCMAMNGWRTTRALSLIALGMLAAVPIGVHAVVPPVERLAPNEVELILDLSVNCKPPAGTFFWAQGGAQASALATPGLLVDRVGANVVVTSGSSSDAGNDDETGPDAVSAFVARQVTGGAVASVTSEAAGTAHARMRGDDVTMQASRTVTCTGASGDRSSELFCRARAEWRPLLGWQVTQAPQLGCVVAT